VKEFACNRGEILGFLVFGDEDVVTIHPLYNVDSEAPNVREMQSVIWGQCVVVVLNVLRQVSITRSMPIFNIREVIGARIQDVGEDTKID